MRPLRYSDEVGGTVTTTPRALEVQGLRKSYGSRVALSDVSLEAGPGELIGCIGPNGAGKTTLLTILAGIQQPDSGTIVRAGGQTGWVPQEPAVYGKLSVEENLTLFARLEGVPDVEGAVAGMLAQTGLDGRAADQVSKLSGGNRQRVNIAIGLLSAPAVLLLDEPSAGLDPPQRQRLWDFIGALAGTGTTVIYSTHDVSEAERFADRVLVLADGEALFYGTPEELRDALVSAGDATVEGDLEAAFVSFLRKRGH
jgi:ABC-2 type transport system ATP-binding protein